MFCFWTYLSLFFVLQHSVSSDEGVSLKCSRTVEVTSGDTVTLNCGIIWKQKCENKSGKFSWNEANNTNNNLCDLEGNTCESDGQTYGSLNISDIQKNKTIEVAFHSHCGMNGSLIRVLVYDKLRTQNPDENRSLKNGKDEEEKNGSSTVDSESEQENLKNEEEKTGSSTVVTVSVFCISAAIIVIMVIFYVQYKIKQRNSLHRRSQQDSLDQL